MIRASISKNALYHNLCYLRKKTKAEVMVVLHLWTFKTPILALKNLNDLNEEFILSIG